MKLSEAIEAIKDASSPDYFKSIDAAELTDWQDVAFTLYAANAELLEALDLICRLATNAGTAPLSLEIALNILLDIATLALDNKHKGE